MTARWFELTREIMPAMASRAGWLIVQDHCFMRVCLDAALGVPWRQAVSPPAFKTMNDDQLARAVTIAEDVVREPELLRDLNARSLALRRACRSPWDRDPQGAPRR